MCIKVELLIISDYKATYPQAYTLSGIRELISDIFLNLSKFYSYMDVF